LEKLFVLDSGRIRTKTLPNINGSHAASMIMPAKQGAPTQHSPNIRLPNASASVPERLARNLQGLLRRQI